MDYRCPLCGTNLAKRKLSQAIIARMQIDCSHCGRKIHLNVHPAEQIAVLTGFGVFVALVAAAYKLQSEALGVAAFGFALLATLVQPVLEKTYLRAWPRYVDPEQAPR